MNWKVITLLVVFIVFSSFLLAQEAPPAPKVYTKIEKFSDRNKLTQFLYGAFFRFDPTPSKVVYSEQQKRRANPNLEGKVIRKIEITTLDPFGYERADPIFIRQNNAYNIGNSMHLKTQPITIRNLMLIKQNDLYDSLMISESERLIREQRYVREVYIYSSPVSKGSDSVDISVRVFDAWSIIPDLVLEPDYLRAGLSENNFLGSGHRLYNEFIWKQNAPYNGFKSLYYIPNIKQTHINSTLLYSTDANGNSLKSVSADRTFYSTLTRWAAGVYLSQNFRNELLISPDGISSLQGFKYYTQDYWAGYAWPIFNNRPGNKHNSNFIVSTRYLRLDYPETPVSIFNANNLYSDEDFYMLGVGISVRKYVQDKSLFKFGPIEDIPLGRAYGITTGYQLKNGLNKLYLGARFAFGNYYDWGYLSSHFEYGAFTNSGKLDQGTFTTGVDYFTRLFELGSWNFRQFIKPQIVLGINRLPGEQLLINGNTAPITDPRFSGVHRLSLTLQSQSYAPWQLLGFKFGPYSVLSFYMMGNEATGFSKSAIYPQLGFGILIRNEYLVFNAFELSIAFYPIIPQAGFDQFKFNSISTRDFGLRNFEFSKPGAVVYK